MAAINTEKENNPYKPGAGIIPGYLSGRENFVQSFKNVNNLLKNGNHHNSYIFYGLRGVGKTALINEYYLIAKEEGMLTSEVIEFGKSETLRERISETAESLLEELSSKYKMKRKIKNTLTRINGFNINLPQVGIGVQLSDTKSISRDLTYLLENIGQLSLEAGTGCILFLDEMQNLSEEELESIVIAFHKIAQKQLPVFLVGAGLPDLREKLFDATGYSPRLFDYQELKLLNESETAKALEKPIESSKYFWDKKVLKEIFLDTQGHPYFIQEYGKLAWKIWNYFKGEITPENFKELKTQANESFNKDFFEPHFKRATEAEQGYLIEMAQDNSKVIKSGILREKLPGARDLRAGLMKKELIWIPRRGEIAFTIAGFKEYINKEYPSGRED